MSLNDCIIYDYNFYQRRQNSSYQILTAMYKYRHYAMTFHSTNRYLTLRPEMEVSFFQQEPWLTGISSIGIDLMA